MLQDPSADAYTFIVLEVNMKEFNFAICPYCNTVSMISEWHRATVGDYGSPITPIFHGEWKNCDYTCPACYRTSEGDQLDIIMKESIKNTFEF